MKKVFVATLAAAACAAAAVTPARAANEGAIVGAAVGGLAVGTIIGSAAARPYYAYPAYAPAPGYVVYSGYGAAYPVSCPGGHWARKPVAFDRAGRPVAWSRPRFICPRY
jgi:hypothetical protein